LPEELMAAEALRSVHGSKGSRIASKADRRSREGLTNAAILVGVWLLLVIVSAIHRPDFISQQTFDSVAFTMSVLGILALAEGLVTISGGILDLSIPTALVVSSWVAVNLLQSGWNTPLVVALTVMTGAAWGFFNALVIVYGKLNPIIVTLGTNFAGIAVMFLLFHIAQTPLHSPLSHFGVGYFLGLPNVFWPMLLLVLVVGFLVKRTRYGRRLMAVGGNAAAAKARGISLAKTRFGVFSSAGALSGVAAILFVGSNSSFTPQDGSNYLLPAIAITILAGISLSGGRGHLWVILIAVGFLSTLPVSLVFFGLSSSWQTVVQGAILIVAVSIDRLRQRGPAV